MKTSNPKDYLGLALALCLIWLPAAFAEPLVDRNALDVIASRVQLERLPNGLRVLFYHRPFAPVFSGVVAVRVGGSDESVGETGISHMFEHMAFKGTHQIGTKDYRRESELLRRLEEIAGASDGATKLNTEQREEWEKIQTELRTLWEDDVFSREYEKRGANSLNATTDTEATQYFVSLPRDSFEFWCRMESDRIRNTVFRQFYQERDVVLEERRMRYEDDPQGKLYQQLLGSAFRVHPYRNPTIGYDFDISRLTATKLAHFREIYYVPSNMVIALVGDVDRDRDLPVVQRYFGVLPEKPQPPRPSAVEPPQEGERRFTYVARTKPELTIAYHKPNYPNFEDVPLSVSLEILAGSKVSPLYIELVKKQRIATSIGQSEAPGNAYPNLMIFNAVPRSPATNEQLLKAFDQVVDKFVKTRVTEEQLDMAKRAISMHYLQGLDSNLSLALALVDAELTYHSWRVMFEWFDTMLKITPDDIEKVNQKYFDKRNRTVAFLEKSPSIREQQEMKR